jgi:hypothetical protein
MANMKAPRQPHDQYETAPWQVDALVDHLPELSGEVWCPTVGDGALSRQLLRRLPHLAVTLTNDIELGVQATHHLDATLAKSWMLWRQSRGRAPNWIVENPPFNVAIDILKHAFPIAIVGVAFLTRISFVEATRDRGPWLATHPRQLQVALERYSFTGDGKSDLATCEWLVWSKIPLSNRGGYTAYGYKKAGSLEI